MTFVLAELCWFCIRGGVERLSIGACMDHLHVAHLLSGRGDIHSSWVHDIKADFNNPGSPTIATEFVGTSISSDFPAEFIAPVQAALPANPHIKFFDGAFRGYVRCQLTQSTWQTDYRAVASILDPNAPVSMIASFVVENGQPGAQQV
jgi:alkaline phosphatase D